MDSKIIPVKYIDQTKLYPTGCESVSTAMLLSYLVIDLSVNGFIDNYIPQENLKTIDGELYGPHPNIKFIGSPYREDGFGCYSHVIYNALAKVFHDFENDKYEPVLLDNVPMSELIENYIKKDKPVIFWATIDLVPAAKGRSWKVFETGEPFTWILHEHCMLLVGYDPDYYYFNDPWKNHGVIPYKKELVEKRHKEMLSMAVSYRIKNTENRNKN